MKDVKTDKDKYADVDKYARVKRESTQEMQTMIFVPRPVASEVGHVNLRNVLALTHISLASQFWDICKQCRPRSDAAKRGVWSGSSLFANRNIYSK